jgi:hypothetical protein
VRAVADTHALHWFLTGSERLSERVRQALATTYAVLLEEIEGDVRAARAPSGQENDPNHEVLRCNTWSGTGSTRTTSTR